jgi:3-methyladenine DNA glycosylase AlkD
LQPATTNVWIEGQNFWLQRAAILHQLMYKEDTDWEMLQSYILKTCHSNEFFIRKAEGWALRQYSKIDPTSVRSFIDLHRSKLSGLTIKEGSKYLLVS